MAAVSMKGTRKTYSFEEREILVMLINKYEDIEEKKSDPASMCRRKSAWSQLAQEYNSIVGPQGARSAVQLRRCWENMRSCKKHREEKKPRCNTESFCNTQNSSVTGAAVCWNSSAKYLRARSPDVVAPPPVSAATNCLPPNVLFEPDSEPFTLHSVSTVKPPDNHTKEEAEERKESSFKFGTPEGSEIESTCTTTRTPECDEAPPIQTSVASDEKTESRIPRIFATASCESTRKTNKSMQKEEELHLLALSEAKMKMDIAIMLKEEAKLRLEEAQYRKEEAKMRMLLFTYKLDRFIDE